MRDLGSKGIAVGEFKWGGIFPMGSGFYCPALNAEMTLAVDLERAVARGLGTKAIAVGNLKWNGIVVLGRSLYAAPFNADTVLAVCPERSTV